MSIIPSTASRSHSYPHFLQTVEGGRERCVTQNCPTPEIRDMGPLVPDPKYICSETQTRIRADQRQRWKQNIIGAIIFFKYATCENYSKSASSSKCQSISMTYDYNTMGISRMKRILLKVHLWLNTILHIVVDIYKAF